MPANRSGQDNAVTNMKHRFEIQRKTALASVLIALVSGVSSTAQTLTLLAEFGRLPDLAGMNPQSQPVQGPDGTLYGTTSDGLDDACDGAVFKVRPDGGGFAVLKSFTNSAHGKWSFAGLTLSGSTLYGTTGFGGSANSGTVFKINTDGTGHAVLRHFGGWPGDGSLPRTSLTLKDGVL
ncbi:MAG: choice-of-anchor tandem repeat GloVer-containing protein [Limisphaerales bacterium]